MCKSSVILVALLMPLIGSCSAGPGSDPGVPSLASPTTIVPGNGFQTGQSSGSITPAGADKVSVCHVDGRGTFRRLSISANALAAHLDHGDGLPGETLPGDPTRKFDDTCAIVNAVTCPCTFTVQALNALNVEFGDLGNDYDYVSSNLVTQVSSRSSIVDRRENEWVMLQAPWPAWPEPPSFVCITRVYSPGFAIQWNNEVPLTRQEAEACVQDLTTLADVLRAKGR